MPLPMVKKLAIASLFHNTTTTTTKDTTALSSSMSAMSSAPSSWQWPSCKHPRTLSFRHDAGDGELRDKAYFLVESGHSCFSSSFESVDASESLSTASDASGDANETEAVVRGLRSDRLFFDAVSTSSILKAAVDAPATAFEGATAVAIDSEDPYRDFRESMEEMVVSHGVKDWGSLEEMLGWYLKANGKDNHGLIVGAFVDLLVALTSPSCSFRGLEVKETREGHEGSVAS